MFVRKLSKLSQVTYSTPIEDPARPSSAGGKYHPGLPLDVIILIISFITTDPQSQSHLHALTLVSRSWYSVAITRLYHSPCVQGRRFDKFVRTVCPSINAGIKKNGLGDLIVRLDLSQLVHEGRKSVTARLLGRVKSSLEEFAAPQASFAVNSLAALSKCSKLRHLDLSCVSESLEAAHLSRATSKLDRLEIFHYPHSGLIPPDLGTEFAICPTNVREFFITGGLKYNEITYKYIRWPSSLTHFSIEACPWVSKQDFHAILEALGPQLRSLKVGKGMPRLRSGGLNKIFHQLPRIYRLSMPLDYIDWVRTESIFGLPCGPSPLVELDIDCEDNKFPHSWDFIWNPFEANLIPNLRRLVVNRSIRWNAEQIDVETPKALDELLRTLAKEDGGATGIDESRAGIWSIGGRYAMPPEYPETNFHHQLVA